MITAAVGYIRVSTEKQQKGQGLRQQAQSILDFGSKHGIRIVGIHQDERTAMDDDILERNLGLAEAIKDAKSRGVPLLTARFDRVTRNRQVGRLLAADADLRIMTVKDGRVLDAATIEAEAAAAEAAGKAIRGGTTAALGEARRSGRKLGNSPHLADARRRGHISIMSGAEARVERIAEFLAKEDPSGSLTAREVAELLNVRGIRPPRKELWSVEGVRSPLRRARQLLAEETAAQEAEEQEVMESLPEWGRF